MKLRFTIHYRTEWGQQLVVLLSHRQQDGAERKMRIPMLTQDGELWQAETAVVDSRRSPILSFTYLYTVEDADGHVLRCEWDQLPRTFGFDSTKIYTLNDQWRDLPLPAHLYTSAYEVTSRMGSAKDDIENELPLFRKTLLFRVSAPQLQQGQQLAVIGSHPVLGSWNPARYQMMHPAGCHEWMLTLNADALLLPLEYKYVVVDAETHQLLQWEEGDNRIVDGSIVDGEVRVLTGDALRLQENPWRAAGVSVPVFSLRSEQSCGVGDFGDLYRFIDWAAEVGMKVIQLLPVNDTTNSHQWGDSYPYNIMSAFDLHPHYIDLNQLPPLKDRQQMTAFRRQQRELNALSYSDYEAVDRVKMEYLKALYEQEKKNLKGDMTFVAYVQHHLHLQLKRAADHARSLGIFLMGDLPIGVSRDSREVKEHPDYFNLDSQTGAPPDAFSQKGQNWGFPTYNWESEGLEAWMAKRMKWMEQYFDAVRIDHVLGFFRIWEIPEEQLFGTMGHFSPALPLTTGEIEYFGLPFRRDFLTRPFINDRIIDRIFGIHAQYVRDTFLVKKAYGLYDLKDEVSTQRRVRQSFDGRGDENSMWIRDGLYRLVENVLFLEDPRQPEMYHPRIQAWQEPVFEVLSNEEKDAYMRIYNNFFYQRHSMFWGRMGYDRLGSLQRATRMLLCAEDLGMLPDCVEPVLDSLRILTLEIQQMPKQAGVEFTHLDGNPVRSVCTISTHDMAPLRLWWQEQPERAQRFFTTMLQKQGRAPEQLPAHLAEEVIARHVYSPSMLCILSLQDWLAMDQELRSKNPRSERINTPSNPFNRWQWRMHLTIGQLLQADRYNQKMRTMIVRSKR
ncbi:MAG: 4-alpha-glucanotransferase [Prevotella sp.]|nr:4-alpha-glucanotransferase [Prevotella sp.]